MLASQLYTCYCFFRFNFTTSYIDDCEEKKVERRGRTRYTLNKWLMYECEQLVKDLVQDQPKWRVMSNQPQDCKLHQHKPILFNLIKNSKFNSNELYTYISMVLF